MLVSAARVMLMTPGLAFFYGGMVRGKNVLGTMMQSFMAVALISVQWIIIGYSLGFGPDKGHVAGGLEWIGLRGVGMTPNPDYAATIPHQAYMIYQGMFAVITPALIMMRAFSAGFAGFAGFCAQPVVVVFCVAFFGFVVSWSCR